MNAGTEDGAIPAKVSENMRPTVTAGFANEVGFRQAEIRRALPVVETVHPPSEILQYEGDSSARCRHVEQARHSPIATGNVVSEPLLGEAKGLPRCVKDRGWRPVHDGTLGADAWEAPMHGRRHGL